MKKLQVLGIIALLMLPLSLSAQVERPVRVWADGASYLYSGDSVMSYAEIYIAVQRADIQFEELEGTYYGKLYLYVEFENKSGDLVDSLGKWLAVPVNYLEDVYKQDVRIFDCILHFLPPGEYHVRVTAVDDNSKRSGLSTFEMRVKDFPTDKLTLSDIEFAYNIFALEDDDSTYSSLNKYDRKVIPNPNGYFSNEDSLLYLFLEAYNFPELQSDESQFEVNIRLLDSYGYELRKYPAKQFERPGKSAVISQAVSLVGLPGGRYRLDVQVRDEATGQKASTHKSFMLIYAFDQLSPTMTSANLFSEEDARLMGKVIHYISTKEEKKLYKSLDLEGKQRFLERFWESKNQNPGSPINEFKNEVFRRFLYANEHFSTSLVKRSDGWKSDRGRIYVTYGEPDYVDRNPSVMETKPQERWEYYRIPGQSGGDYFIFVDESGYGDYQLVHSTLRGEISNPDWDRQPEDGRN